MPDSKNQDAVILLHPFAGYQAESISAKLAGMKPSS
jgi:hypothetical protein